MVADYDEDKIFTDATAPMEKEISVGAGGDFDEFDGTRRMLQKENPKER